MEQLVYKFSQETSINKIEHLLNVLRKKWPSFKFATTVTLTNKGLIEKPIFLMTKNVSVSVYENMVVYARGYMDGFNAMPHTPTLRSIENTNFNVEMKSKPCIDNTIASVINNSKQKKINQPYAMRFKTQIGIPLPQQTNK